MTTKNTNGKAVKLKASVNINVEHVVYDADGETIIQVGDEPLTVKKAMMQTLTVADGNISGDEKIKRGRIASKLAELEGDTMNLLREDAEMVRNVLKEKLALPIIAMRVDDIFKKALED